MTNRLLRLLTFLVAALAISLQGRLLWTYYSERLPNNDYTVFRIIGQHIQLYTTLSLAVISIIIVLRSRTVNALYLALTLAAFCAQGHLNVPQTVGSYIFVFATTIIIGNIFITSFQYFPVRITARQVSAALRYSWMKWCLVRLLRPATLWTVMTLILGLIGVAEYLVPSLGGGPSNLLILLTGFAYLFINFRLNGGKDRDKILWLFWGLAMYIMLTALYSVLFMFQPPGENTNVLFVILSSLVLLFAFVMSLFFADAFDTRIFVKKTTVNAAIFLLVVFIYNTVEHFLLHWISHTLHISNVLLSSLFSGFLVLCISPLHHRLTHFLNHRLNKNRHDQTNAETMTDSPIVASKAASLNEG